MRWEMPADGTPASKGADAVLEQTCANCKMTVERDAVVKGGRTFCCDGCAYGGPCIC